VTVAVYVAHPYIGGVVAVGTHITTREATRSVTNTYPIPETVVGEHRIDITILVHAAARNSGDQQQGKRHRGKHQ
jgi:hypothetical protein